MRIAPTSHFKGDTVELFLLEASGVTHDYVDWLNDPETNRYLESRFFPHTLDSTLQFVERCLTCSSTLLLGIRSIDLLGKHVGNIKVGNIDMHHGLGEIGILIGDKSAWGKGIASQAIRLMINVARDQLGLRKLTAGCYASNVGSKKAFLKAGFIIAGERKAHFLLEGKTESFVLMDYFLT